MIYYQTERYGTEIKPIEVEKVTEHFAYVVSQWGTRTTQRKALKSDWGDIYPTRQEAVDALLARLTLRIQQAQSSLDRAKNELATFKRKETTT